MVVKAVGLDFFGTLVQVSADSESCIRSMYDSLRDCGYAFSYEDFVLNYRAATSEFRKTRNEQLREVNNCIWVASTLEKMGQRVKPSHQDIVRTVERYFSPWQIALAPDALNVLKWLNSRFTVSLITNFTDTAFICRCLKRLGIEEFFAHVVVSDSVGWRKPHPNIFKVFLDLSHARPEEAIYVGDEMATDIAGAKGVGIRTVLLTKDGIEHVSKDLPDHSVNSLTEFKELLGRIS